MLFSVVALNLRGLEVHREDRNVPLRGGNQVVVAVAKLIHGFEQVSGLDILQVQQSVFEIDIEDLAAVQDGPEVVVPLPEVIRGKVVVNPMVDHTQVALADSQRVVVLHQDAVILLTCLLDPAVDVVRV